MPNPKMIPCYFFESQGDLPAVMVRFHRRHSCPGYTHRVVIDPRPGPGASPFSEAPIGWLHASRRPSAETATFFYDQWASGVPVQNTQ